MLAKNEIKFNWKENKNYNISPITSIHGGIWKGEVVANFMFERHSLPQTQTVPVSSNGVMQADKATSVQDSNITIEVISTFTLNYQAAIEIGKWLVERGEELKESLLQNAFKPGLN